MLHKKMMKNAVEPMTWKPGQRLFFALVRNRVKARLMSEYGYTREGANSALVQIDDDLIEDAVVACTGLATTDLFGGSFLDWLSEHKDTILQIIQFILTIILSFAKDK